MASHEDHPATVPGEVAGALATPPCCLYAATRPSHTNANPSGTDANSGAANCYAATNRYSAANHDPCAPGSRSVGRR
jgi:hypothetical protein